MKLRGILYATALTGGVMAMALPAQAESFEVGDVDIVVDTTVSLGVGIRASDQDCYYIAVANGGCPDEIGQSANINRDDGNINFEQWDVYSLTAKVLTELDVQWRDYGLFARGKAFYDYIGHQEAGENSTRFGRRPLEDALRGDDAVNAAGRSIDLLDLFVYGNFELGELPITVRAGKQVINWGESLAIQGGINQFLPIDVAAIRTPGAELKEALLPNESLYFNLGLPASMNLEAFYAWNWRKTELDPVGTFFSGFDFFGAGGAYIQTAVDGPFGGAAGGILRDPRDGDPDDQGQFGVKLGYYADWLNDGTDLAAYYVNYHSNKPYLVYSNGIPSAVGGTFDPALSLPAGTIAGVLPDQTYQEAYAEDIEFFGVSFNTTIPILGGTALSGEVLYAPDMPFQISSAELLAGRWIQNVNTHVLGGADPSLNTAVLPYDDTIGGFGTPWLETDAIHGQLYTLSTLSPSEPFVEFTGADLFVLIANWGFQYLPSISPEEQSVLSAGRGSEITHPDPTVTALIYNPLQPLVRADKFSHGYRLIAQLQYNNAFGTPWTMTPSVQWGHDFSTSAGPNGPGFLDGRKTISVGVDATLQNTWKAGVRYTNSFGNKFQNITQDRDFLTFDVSYSF